LPSPAFGGARQQSPKIRILKIGGTFWTKSELFLTKIRTANFERPTAARFARCPAKKFSSHFLFCGRPIFSSKRKRKLFLLTSALNEQGGGASLRQAGKNSFPQTPFLFARLLSGFAKNFSEDDGLQNNKGGGFRFQILDGNKKELP